MTMRDSTQFQPFRKAPAVWLRIWERRVARAVADSPLLRLLAALGILTSWYFTLFLLMGGW